jgi:adenosine deaminase CECR1
MSYDYYEAYMSWDLDISSLKQISQNSILYSGMSQQEKQTALKEWQLRWDLWIESFSF